MGRPAINLLGQRFGRLLVIKRIEDNPEGRSGKHARWLCKCDCGKFAVETSSILKAGEIKSCGCFLVEKHLTHGKTGTRLYNVWNTIKQRCLNPNNCSYKWYGARGITVCKEWLENYELFEKWALENGYKPEAARGETTIDRIDVDGNYEPSNCRWVTMQEQMKNRRIKKCS